MKQQQKTQIMKWTLFKMAISNLILEREWESEEKRVLIKSMSCLINFKYYVFETCLGKCDQLNVLTFQLND